MKRGDPSEHRPVKSDLDHLRRQLAKRQPRVTLEYGVGFSTFVFAEHGSEHHVIDASAHWIENTRSKGDWPTVTFHLCPLENLGDCHRYVAPDLTPDLTPDLIYLDGPSPRDVPNWNGPPIACDPLALIKPGLLLIVDGRPDNVAYLRNHITQPHEFTMRGDIARFAF